MQHTAHILMIRPVNFNFNAETAIKKQLRLQLAVMTANTLKSGMELLGIRVPERM